MPDSTSLEGNLEPSVDPSGISRRRLLKALVASGLAVAGSSLPAHWFSPEVEVGVLPAHAQVSPPPYAILRCYADWDLNYDGWAINGGCYITPAAAGIQMRWRIVLEAPNHSLDGQEIFVDVGLTDAAGLFAPALLDIGQLINMYEPGVIEYTFHITWEFVNAGEGTGTCQSTVPYFVPQ